MRIIRSVQSMQRQALAWKRSGQRIAFVPTMGYLHAGHVSLMHRARRAVGPKGIVGVSIFVNPTQFAPHEDLAKYPRDFPRDTKLCREAGVDFLFFPTNDEIYSVNPKHSTYIIEEAVSQRMEGSSRPTHFRGVATIVAKLFNIVLPDVSVFGAKDFQQAAVIQRMTRDLNFPVKIIVAPTVREHDGLAMSSRNKYLSPEERPQALALWNAIQTARAAAKKSPTSDSVKETLRAEITKHPAAKIDYIEFFNPQTLEPAARVRKGMQIALAVFIGKTRLIDNARL